MGIEYRDTDAFIDEIPAAYKDIDQVMADAADLVDIQRTLRQLINVKGDSGLGGFGLAASKGAGLALCA